LLLLLFNFLLLIFQNKNLALNDDTLLERVKFTNPEEDKLNSEASQNLSQLEQVVLFGSLYNFLLKFIL
jgi:hypothetical protein